MAYKRHFRPKVGKLTFTNVAKASDVRGLTTKKFKDKAFEALREAGYGKTDAKSILSGSKKMEQGSLRNVFNKLRKSKVITKGGGAVTEYVKKEKVRQERVVRMHLRERSEEIKEEREAEEKATQQQTKERDKPSQATSKASSQAKKEAKTQHTPQIAGGSLGVSSSPGQDAQFDQTPYFIPKTNIKQGREEGLPQVQDEGLSQPEEPEELEDMMID